ncbi:hypothetical protein STAL104432_18965 [Streptomyces albus]
MLVALVNGASTRSTCTDPGPVSNCPVCARFDGPVPTQPGTDGKRRAEEEWLYERRIHHVAHHLAPKIVTMPPERSTLPNRPSTDQLSPTG